MNPAQNNSSPEDDLTQTLQRQAERFAQSGGSSLDLEQVVSRAGEIRRGRRMRASMVMAAVVLAIAVPIGITVVGNDPSNPGTPGPAAQPNLDPISLSDLKSGRAPATGYAEGAILHLTTGEISITGPHAKPVEYAEINGGALVSANSDSGTLTAQFIPSADGSASQRWPMVNGFAVSADGNVGAFVRPDGTVMAVQDAGSLNFEVGKIPNADTFTVDAVVGENCSGRSEEVGCTIYVTASDHMDATSKTWAISPHRTPTIVYPDFRRLDDIAANGDVAGMVSATDSGSCSEIRSADDAKLWSTCDYQFEHFSPNGKYLLATIPYFDGLGTSRLTIIEVATHQVVLSLDTVRDAAITSMIWEDDGHVLANILDGSKSAVVRIGLVGDRESAVTPVAASLDDPSPFLLPSS